MSAIFLLFYWIIIPVIALGIAYGLIRRAATRRFQSATAAACAVGLVWLGWTLFGGEKWWVDRQVRELCARDGGIKVYETVRLPTDRFNKWGQPNFFRATQHENALGPEYVFKVESKFLREKEPYLRRYHVTVARRSDQRLLGETILYVRGGGDLPGPWMGSSFSCPRNEDSGEVQLLTNIFIQSTKEKSK